MENIIKFAKLQEDVIIPSKRDEDGDYDLYANFKEDTLLIKSHEIKLISTGLISSFDKKYKIAFKERGSNTKSKLILIAGEIDSGFRNEWFVALYNTTHHNIVIDKTSDEYIMIGTTLHVPYSKAICQFAIEEVPKMIIEEVSVEEIKNIKSERGKTMLGASGK